MSITNRFIPLSELEKLFDSNLVSTKKIDTITIVRRITGEGLTETKDWVEQFLIPTVTNMPQNQIQVLNDMSDFNPDEILQQLDSLRRDVAELKREKQISQAKEIF